MKFAIYGAGAIGAYLGALLARSGEDVTLIARGPHLQAMRTNGVRIITSKEDTSVPVRATDDPDEVGPVDVVVLGVKAHGLPAIAGKLGPLLSSETSVLAAQNGVPWWYFYKHGGALEGTNLATLDPDGVINRNICIDRVIGCVVYPSAVVLEPGVIQHVEGDRFSIGELDGSTTDRCKQIAEAFIRSGLRCPIRPRIRQDIWVKLLGSVAFNPLSALTRATLEQLATDPEISFVAREVMAEADTIARALGVPIPVTIEQRLNGAAKVGAHKTSMLQDLELGRPMELGALVGAVIELGETLGIKTPTTRIVYGCAKLLEANSLR